jgi:hypothetical protein
MNMDRHEEEQLRLADEMRLEAERLKLEFERLVQAGLERYHCDVEFHARVYQVARVIDMDPDFLDLHTDRGIPQWELALGLALKAVVAQEEMQPGGVLDFTQVQG